MKMKLISFIFLLSISTSCNNDNLNKNIITYEVKTKNGIASISYTQYEDGIVNLYSDLDATWALNFEKESLDYFYTITAKSLLCDGGCDNVDTTVTINIYLNGKLCISSTKNEEVKISGNFENC